MNWLRARLLKTIKFDVRDYGAYGDHVHDDTVAIQSAIAAAADYRKSWKPWTWYRPVVVWLEKGTYLISGKLDWSVFWRPGNISMRGEDASTTTITNRRLPGSDQDPSSGASGGGRK